MKTLPDISSLQTALRERVGAAVTETLVSDLSVAGAAAMAGGEAILPYYRGSAASGGPRSDADSAGTAGRRPDLEVEHKAPDDPVTAADFASNHAILALLATERPEDPVLSEESEPPSETAQAGRLWVVDPLDGTREFIDGLGEFATMVGLAVGGSCLLGAVYRPDPGVLELGFAAGGAWRAKIVVGAAAPALARTAEEAGPADLVSEIRLGSLRVPRRTAGPMRLVHSRSHRPGELDELEAALGALESVPSGSVGVKCGLIASGEADLYVHPVPYLKEWDTCAPEAVLRGAGGRVTDCLGEPLTYGKTPPIQPEGILAAEPEVWSRVLTTIRHIAPGV